MSQLYSEVWKHPGLPHTASGSAHEALGHYMSTTFSPKILEYSSGSRSGDRLVLILGQVPHSI